MNPWRCIHIWCLIKNNLVKYWGSVHFNDTQDYKTKGIPLDFSSKSIIFIETHDNFNVWIKKWSKVTNIYVRICDFGSNNVQSYVPICDSSSKINWILSSKFTTTNNKSRKLCSYLVFSWNSISDSCVRLTSPAHTTFSLSPVRNIPIKTWQLI